MCVCVWWRGGRGWCGRLVAAVSCDMMRELYGVGGALEEGGQDEERRREKCHEREE